jgi:hypothetical protein
LWADASQTESRRSGTDFVLMEQSMKTDNTEHDRGKASTETGLTSVVGQPVRHEFKARKAYHIAGAVMNYRPDEGLDGREEEDLQAAIEASLGLARSRKDQPSGPAQATAEARGAGSMKAGPGSESSNNTNAGGSGAGPSRSMTDALSFDEQMAVAMSLSLQECGDPTTTTTTATTTAATTTTTTSS